MRGSLRSLSAYAVTGLLAVGVAACGSSSNSSSSGAAKSSSSGSSTTSIPLKPGENPVGQTLTGKKKGGTLTVYSTGDFQHLDPGQAYYALDYALTQATNRSLFSYPPNSPDTVRPDLATEIPTTSNGGITDGGKTVTVHIRPNVHYSPPVNRAVTSKDVAFAIERGGNPNVGNAYFPAYFGAASPAPLLGTASKSYKGGPIPGITTPNKTTIVFHMAKAGSTLLITALTLPVTDPLPPEFVGPLDKKAPTTYGTQYLVSTGPYMVQADKTGKIAGLGYQPTKSETLVRNPNWTASTDFRPAYLDRINVNVGGDATVVGQQVLKGSSALQLDTPSQAIVKLGYQTYPSQITFTPGSGDHYIGINNAAGPFKNVNLRRAVWANLDRAAEVKARGGSLVSQPATHFIYPGVSGFQQAGGYPGPQTDFNKNVNGDLAVAMKYMKAAGYSGGKYTGSASVQIVGANSGNSPAIVQIVNSDLTALGFKTHVSLVDQAVMYGKYCGVPKQEIDICPTVGWIRDFADPLSVMYPTFYGPSIVPTNNSNWGQVNDPAINAAMVKAAGVVDPAARAQAWANVDKMLVDQASAIPETFENQPNIESKNVAGVNQLWNEGTWDFNFTSLK
ncbi:MAG: ABC transporter substrate-binding protein [Actinomycetota bacterium]|nr:ABC transporter substrate-binding protein [Actinomycetota bacterium]